ncbi:MAG: YgiQ family radical SAM protein [Lachnospiraceae bacterium]|nr:YgiQ family radical SAM protein [Lachnospiraceae bacterium]
MQDNLHGKAKTEQSGSPQQDTGQFLPVCRADLKKRNIEQLDFVYITGDAYVDHPSFGTAIISRVLEAHGYTVGIVAQPDWKDEASITILGRPRLAFLVSAGNMDSCVNHYYVSKKHRESDAYTPGGKPYQRPDHATVVYGNLIRRVYRDVPIILGGIEASLRRLAHYDYWSDSFKRSVLLDSGADLISYGMGEKSMVEIAEALDAGIDIKDLTFIKGTVYRTRDVSGVYDSITLPDYESMKSDRLLYAKSFKQQHDNTDPFTGKALIEEYPNRVYVVQNPPQEPLTMQEMDDIYALPYMRTYHPMYEAQGGIPAVSEIKFSLISNRGCFGGCSFCALTFHQGRTIQVRSHESILREAKKITEDPEFKGYIHDVGGPTANFRHPSCEKQLTKGVCKNRQCLFPQPCPNLKVDHSDYLRLLRSIRTLPKVKKVFVRSGIRFDYLILDKDDTFFRELVLHHISGQLKVAPEHICDPVLMRMGKPKNEVYEKFLAKYRKLNEQMDKKQFVVPYLMSSHPGSTIKEAVELAEYLRDLGYMPQQVQDFYPTPSTMSTVMYYTGVDPRDMKPVYVVKNPHEKAMQRALIQYRDPKNYELVKEALHLAGREDLIGFDQKCLIRPRKLKAEKQTGGATKRRTEKQSERAARRGVEKQADGMAKRRTEKQADGAAKRGAEKKASGAVKRRTEKQAEGAARRDVEKRAARKTAQNGKHKGAGASTAKRRNQKVRKEERK